MLICFQDKLVEEMERKNEPESVRMNYIVCDITSVRAPNDPLVEFLD